MIYSFADEIYVNIMLRCTLLSNVCVRTRIGNRSSTTITLSNTVAGEKGALYI